MNDFKLYICYPNDILWSIKHLRSKLEYTQKGLRTYLSVLKLILDWNSHAPGPGEETDIDSLIVTGAVAVGSVKVFKPLRYPACLKEFVFD